MIRVLVFIKKLPGTDRAHFQQYYETRHAPLVNRLLPFYQRYRRNYLDHGVRSDHPAEAFDVVTELEFASQHDYDAWLEALGNPEILSQIREDERNFIDQKATRMWVVTSCADELPRRGTAADAP
jgi:uncharacterized protein (TIGR02118 family)